MTETKWKVGDWVAVAMEVVNDGHGDEFLSAKAASWENSRPVGLTGSDIIGPAKRPIRVGDKVQRWYMTGNSAERLDVVYDGGDQMLTRDEVGILRLIETADLRHWPIKEGEE